MKRKQWFALAAIFFIGTLWGWYSYNNSNGPYRAEIDSYNLRSISGIPIYSVSPDPKVNESAFVLEIDTANLLYPIVDGVDATISRYVTGAFLLATISCLVMGFMEEKEERT